MTLAVYPGSFDPITNGHLDVIAKAVRLFDEVRVAVLHNPSKQPLFSLDERMSMIREVVSVWPTVKVESFRGLLAVYAHDVGANAVVRGLRSVSDFEAELPMAHMNQRMNDSAVTVFVPSSLQYADISSSLVKQIAMYQGPLTDCVPASIERALRAKYVGGNA